MAAEDRKGLRVKNLLWVGETEQEAENVLVYSSIRHHHRYCYYYHYCYDSESKVRRGARVPYLPTQRRTPPRQRGHIWGDPALFCQMQESFRGE